MSSTDKPCPDDLKYLCKLVAGNLRRTGATISHLHRLLSTPQGIDRALGFLYYLCTLLAPTEIRFSPRLRLLAGRISDVRMFLRLWGLVGIYQWGSGKLPQDGVERALVVGQVVANTCFQVLENLAYLNRHGILEFSKRREGTMWLWSTRCWSAHILLEFARLERVRELRGKKAGEGGKEMAAWRKSWICNAANAPLSLHWGTPGGLISETAVGALGSISAVISLRDAWRNSA